MVNRGKDDAIHGFSIKGHALYGDPGEDVVCAAVSAVSQAAVLGLEEHVGLELTVEIEEGSMWCRLPLGIGEEKSIRAQAILHTMFLAIKSIAQDYPERISISEVKND